MFVFCFTIFYFLSWFFCSIQNCVAGMHFHSFFFMKRNIAAVICPSERRKIINIISVQLPLELGDLYYRFGSRGETDAISKVLNLKFWNLCLSKTIKHLICQCSFMQRFFLAIFSSNKLGILFYSDIHHLHVNPLQCF